VSAGGEDRIVIDCSLAAAVVGSSRRHDLKLQLAPTERPIQLAASCATRSGKHRAVEVIEPEASAVVGDGAKGGGKPPIAQLPFLHLGHGSAQERPSLPTCSLAKHR